MKITTGQEIREALAAQIAAAKLPESDVPGWTHDKIRKEFDRNPNLTVKDLARKTGLSTAEVKKILREGANKWASRRAIMEITAEGQRIREALGFPKTAGYTHYWYLQKRDDGTYGFTTSEWSRVKGAASQIIKKAIADGIRLGGPMGSGRPKVTSDHIALNGVGPESGESFFLQRNDEPKSYQRPQDGAFSFTKTRRKPYDPVVVSILAAAQKLAPDAIEVDSDGGRGAITRIYAQETTLKVTTEGQQIRTALGLQKTAASKRAAKEHEEWHPRGWAKALDEFDAGIEDFHDGVRRIAAALDSLGRMPMSRDMHAAADMRAKRWRKVGDNVNPMQDDFYTLSNMLEKEGRQLRAALGFPKDAGKFDLGRMVQTRGVAHKARENREFGREIKDALRKYVRGDWGKSKDKRMNDQAVKNGDDRIMGVYPTDEGDIWIITEWDRSVTTILFPNEY